MKTQIIVALIATGLAFSASAEDQPVEQTMAATGVADAQSISQASVADNEIQYRTYSAGNQLLIDLSAKVGGDLDDRLQREVGQEVTIRMRSHEMLVSTN